MTTFAEVVEVILNRLVNEAGERAVFKRLFTDQDETLFNLTHEVADLKKEVGQLRTQLDTSIRICDELRKNEWNVQNAFKALHEAGFHALQKLKGNSPARKAFSAALIEANRHLDVIPF